MGTARNGFAPTRPATPHQRQYARILMRELDLPTDRITLLHRRWYEKAGVPEQEPGTRLDVALGALNFAQASSLIGVLEQERKEQRGDDEDDS